MVEDVGGEAGTIAEGAAVAWVPAPAMGLGGRRADGPKQGACGAAGKVAVAGAFAEGLAVFGEDSEGEVAGLGGGVGGAAFGEFIGRAEEFADRGLSGPDDELAEGDFVGGGDVDEWLVALEEVGEDGGDVEGGVVDPGVDGLGEDVV
ncbi:MAG: hypothetical protein KF678_09500 [Phycisphaeraceae bacterium]|nr:hypothetical protein [Phycisphaeraceae bacterium]